MKLTSIQKHVILELLKFPKQIQILAGLAGTGKTTIISHIYRALDNCAVCAYTGKAASVLRDKGVPATTIHSLIYVPRKDEYGNFVHDDYGNLIFDKAKEIAADVVIIDEASMISKEIYEDLVSYNIPLIFVGDHGQLEPIGENINLMSNPDFKLEEIHRNAGEIAHFCQWIRQGYRPAAFARHLRENKIKFIPKSQMESYFLSVNQVICAFNRTRVNINAAIRQMKGYEEDLVVGDRIMCLKNNHQIGLFNGMQGTIRNIFPHNRIRFNSEGKNFNIAVDRSQFGRGQYNFEGIGKDDPNPFDWCYCITCHKAQGSEYRKVLVVEQRCRNWDHRRWAYTAASRAQDVLIWVFE